MTDFRQPEAAARRLVLVFGVFMLILGAVFLLFTGPVLRWVQIEVTSPSAWADLRALYGGLSLAVGALLLRSLRDPSWLAPSLFLAMASTAGPAVARIYSISVSGMPNRLVLIYLALEILGFVWALQVYRRFINHSMAAAPQG